MVNPQNSVWFLDEEHYSLSFVQSFTSGNADDFKQADYLPDYHAKPQTLSFMTEDNQTCLYMQTEGQKKKRHGIILAENIYIKDDMAVEIKIKPLGDSEAVCELWLTGPDGQKWVSFTIFGGYYGFIKETIINFNGESVHLPDKLWDWGNWYYLHIQLGTDKTVMALLNEKRYILASYCFQKSVSSLFNSFSIVLSQELGMDNKWSSLMKSIITDVKAGRSLVEVQDLISIPNKNDLVVTEIKEELKGLSIVNDLMDRYNKLVLILEKYQEHEPKIGLYIRPLVKEYVIYYDLPVSFLDSDDKDSNTLVYYKIINEYPEYTPKELVEALNYFSNYNILKSKFYDEYSDDVSLVLFNIYNKLYKDNFFTKHFGSGALYPYYVFKAAIFEDESRKSIMNDSDWQKDYYNAAFHKKNKIKIIGGILKTIDSIIRSLYGYPKLIEKPKIFKKHEEIVAFEIKKFCTDNMKLDSHIGKIKIKNKSNVNEKRKEKVKLQLPDPKPVEIDESKLEDIRISADNIRERLIINETMQQDEAVSKDESTVTNVQSYISEKEGQLSEVQALLIKAILENDTLKMNELLHKNGFMLSIVVDEINEKLFEQLNDNCIEFDEDKPYIVKDYIDDLKGIISL